MSVRVWKIDPEALRHRLEGWATALGEDPTVLAVVLFGSLARGEATAASDADVLVVLRHSDLEFGERSARLRPTGLGVGVDLFAYTADEARRAVDEGWGVARHALEEGEVLFQREGWREALGT